MNPERDKWGCFVKSERSLHPKTIGLRLHQVHYQELLTEAKKTANTSAGLAREIIEQWLDQRRKEDES